MKTKTKILALVKISIVLCSVFLVGIQGIGAEQTAREMSASEVTTASEDDYVLGIYGNANEDDTIDMGDVVYTKLAIFGKKPKTELCDAKYDGRINVLDVIQTKLIILGKEKELTIVDSADRIVTVKKPVNRIIPFSDPEADAIRVLGAEDKVVGIGSGLADEEILLPVMSKLPTVGSGGSLPDIEKILELNPDIVISLGTTRNHKLEEKLEPAGISVIKLELRWPKTVLGEFMKLAYIIDKEDKAEEIISWWGGYMDMFKSRTEKLSEEQKPQVFIERYPTPSNTLRYVSGGGSFGDQQCEIAGAINVASELPSVARNVDPEWVARQDNIDIIIQVVLSSTPSGYGVDDLSGVKAVREADLSNPVFKNINAIKNGDVYGTACDIRNGLQMVIGTAYWAKLFQPDLFEDLDPEAIQQEYLTRFQRVNYDLDEHGVFFYPPIEVNGGLAGIPDRYKGEI